MTKLVSPVLVDRDGELRQLRDAFAAIADGEGRAILVEGDPGLGKTRLVREALARSNRSVTSLTGHCVALSDGGLPYGPFTEALRAAAREAGEAGLAGLVGAAHAAQLTRIIPGIAGEVIPDSSSHEMGRAHLFEAVLALLDALAQAKPLVLVLEDLHWAHATTIDLAAFLAPALPRRVLLVATYRPCEGEANPGLRRALAAMSRHPAVSTLRLAALGREAVSRQLAGLLSREAGADLLEAVWARGGGVPLFTEALLAPGGGLRDRLTLDARALVLGPLADLPPDAATVVRAAGVIGREIDPQLIAAVLKRDVAEIETSLRAALARGLLSLESGRLGFRHDLIRRELDAEALPSERARLHAAAASIIEAEPGIAQAGWRAARLAEHWTLAGQPAHALRWSWIAAQEAAAAFAYPEQLGLLERVLELWRQAPEAGGALGLTVAQVRALAVDAACWAGEVEAGLSHLEAALETPGASDTDLVAALLLQRASLREQALAPGPIADLEQALRLARSPGPLRAEALAQLCRVLILAGRSAEAARLCAELQDLARKLGTVEFQIEAEVVAAQLANRGTALPAADIEEIRRRARRADLGRVEVLAILALLDAHLASGRYAAVIAEGREGLRRAAELGQARYRGVLIGARLAAALVATGEWAAADQVIDDGLALQPPPWGRACLLVWRGEMGLARGDAAEVKAVLEALGAYPDHEGQEMGLRLARLRLALEGRRVTRDLADGLQLAACLDGGFPGASGLHLWPALTSALRICVEAARTADRDLLRACGQVRPALMARAAATARSTAVEEAYAEAASADVAPDSPAAWQRVAQAWARLGRPLDEAEALMRAASGQRARDGARQEMIARAAAIAARIGARPLAEASEATRSADLARRDSRAYGLTPREVEVLRMLAGGHSNAQIATALAMAPKTASVHVSNILGKLGVRSRGAAAAEAWRLKLAT